MSRWRAMQLSIFLQGSDGEPINAVVEFVICVTFNLDPGDIVLLSERDELLPQFLIFHGFFGRRTPSVLLPPGEPALSKGTLNICAVGVQSNAARLLERAEAFDRGLKLHPIVGRQRCTPTEHALMPAVPEKRRPASRTRIAAAGSICINRDFFHVRRVRIMWSAIAPACAPQVECRCAAYRVDTIRPQNRHNL